MSETVIKVENLSKIYKLYDKPIDRMKEALNVRRKKYFSILGKTIIINFIG